MARIARNQLLLAFIVIYLIYWLYGYFAPFSWLSLAVSMLIFLSSGITFVRYAPTSYRILFKGDRSEDAEGAHFAQLGVTLLAAGLWYIAVWSMTWNYFERPESWTIHPLALVGRFTAGFGLAMLLLSPDVTASGFKLPKSAWKLAVAIGVLIFVFLLGGRVLGGGDRFDLRFSSVSAHIAAAEQCRVRPWWGNVSSRGGLIYHGPNSPYRKQVAPDVCFTTEAEALRAGFRPSK